MRQSTGMGRLHLAIAAFALGAAGLFGAQNPDTFGHLAAGRQIVELGHVPATDSFSIHDGEPRAWTNYEWLSALIFYAAFLLGGLPALVVLKALLLAVLGALLVRIALDRGGQRAGMLTALLLLVMVPAARFRLSVRPHIFGFVLTALYIWLLDRLASVPKRAPHRRALRLGVTLVLLHVAWVNLHGSHLLGLLLTGISLGVYWAEPVVRGRLAWVLGGQLLACGVSPYGPAIVIDAVDHVLDPAYRQLVTEWSAWSASHPLLIMLSISAQSLLLLLAVSGLRRAGGPGRVALLTALLFGIMAVRSVRFAAEYLLLATPLVAWGLAPRLASLRSATAATLFAGALVYAPLAASRLPPHTAPGLLPNLHGLPAVSAGWLKANHPRARVLSAMEDGWFLMWAAPDAHFVLDGRVPFYGVAHTRLIQRTFASGSVFDSVADRFAIDAVVVQPALAEQASLIAHLQGRDDFALVSIEDARALYVRIGALRGSPPMHHLAPGYDPTVVLGQDADEVGLREELARVARDPNTRLIRAWYGALLELRPFARAGVAGGLRPPANQTERQAFARASRDLGRVTAGRNPVAIVRVYAAAAAIGACEPLLAEERLKALERDGGNRESLLLRQELLLRLGKTAAVSDFVTRARVATGDTPDPWLDALALAVENPPHCP